VIPVAEIERAREVLAGTAIRTPLVRLDVDSDAEIWLKLEVLQPVRSFKIRGAGNAILQASDEELAGGVLTASAGNMAQGVAYAARLRGVPATIVVPEHAPQTKIDAIERYGGRAIKVPYEEWWQVLVSGVYESAAIPAPAPAKPAPALLEGSVKPTPSALFIHPVDNDRVMAGNGTIGLELLEQSPDFDTVVVPYGGGGLLTGIASAVKAARPEVRFYVAEPETGAPVAATLAAGTPTAVDYQPSFVDGSGSRELIPRVWEQASELLDGAFALPLDEVAAAVRLIAERTRVIAEGAGALSVAVATSSRLAGAKKVVCIVSGGNIDPAVLSRILVGERP
jgi:threonine dehydratase